MMYAADLRRCKSFPKHSLNFQKLPGLRVTDIVLVQGSARRKIMQPWMRQRTCVEFSHHANTVFLKQLKDPELYDAAQPLGLGDAFEAEINKASGQGQSGGLPTGKKEVPQREDAVSSPDAASRLPGIKF